MCASNRKHDIHNLARPRRTGHDGTLRVWPSSGLPVQGKPVCEVYDGHRDTLSDLAWGEDETAVVSGSRDGTVRVWDRRLQVRRHPLPAHASAWVRTATHGHPHGMLPCTWQGLLPRAASSRTTSHQQDTLQSWGHRCMRLQCQLALEAAAACDPAPHPPLWWERVDEAIIPSANSSPKPLTLPFTLFGGSASMNPCCPLRWKAERACRARRSVGSTATNRLASLTPGSSPAWPQPKPNPTPTPNPTRIPPSPQT